MKVTISVPSFAGGVSTQPDPIRLPTQAEVSNNTYATVLEGLKRRPPTEFLGKLLGFPAGLSAFHGINAIDGAYVVAASDEALKVFDVAAPGSSLLLRNKLGTTAVTGDFAYLDTTDPERDLRFLTLADYTIVLNRSKTVLADTTLNTALESQALVTIVQALYSKKYGIKVVHPTYGTRTASFTTFSSNGLAPGTITPVDIPGAENSIKGDLIAANLVTLLTSVTAVTGGVASGTALDGTWTVDARGSHLRIKRNDGTEFAIEIEESVGSTSMALVHKEVQIFSDLPVKAIVGARCKIIGEADAVGYWVEFVPHAGAVTTGWADGYWREAAAPGISKGLQAATLPHALLRQANGEWRWTPFDGHSYVISGTTYTVPKWDTRDVGDETTNKQPAFTGRVITGMCFHEGRLGLLSQDTLSLSEAREPFSFFRTSTTEIVPSDRIEARATSPRGEHLLHALPIGNDIALFAEGTQFLVRAEGAFAPNTTSIASVGRYAVDSVAEPIVVRDAIMAPSALGTYGRLQELRVAGDQRLTMAAADLTASIPGYLPMPKRVAHDPQLDLVLWAPATGTDLYCLTYFWHGADRLQNAWAKWTLAGGVTALRHLWMHESYAYVVATVGAETHLLKMRLEPYQMDSGAPVLHLDHRLAHNSPGVSSSVSGSTTTFTLPYTPSSNIQVYAQSTLAYIKVLEVTGLTVKVAGIHNATSLFMGYPYATRHDLSLLQALDRENTPVSECLLRLDSGSLLYDQSGPVEVWVTPSTGVESISYYSGPYLGGGANYHRMEMTSGRYTFGIRGRAADTRISFRTESAFPLRLVSMDVTARLEGLKGRRM